MIAEVSPELVEMGPGETCTIEVHITNTTPLIDAYSVSLFGLDPSWITVDQPRLSLFPDESGSVYISIQLPENFPAGHRQLSVHVRSENDSAEFALTSLGLLALGQYRVRMRIDPVVVTAGKEASFGLVLNNDGNTTVTALASATDPEEMVEITLAPIALDLAPGHQDVIQSFVSARRPWFGQPKVRVITFAIDTTTRVEAIGTFIQRPRIPRWLLALMGLLLAAAVFAIVLSRTFDSVVDEASVDQALLSEALNKGGEGGQTVPIQPGGAEGKVVLFSTKEGVAGVQAELFDIGDTTVPIATAATSEDGSYAFSRLSAGKFTIRFSGAGFNDTWYENAATAATAQEFEVELKAVTDLADVELGGRPGSVAGNVVASDLTGITATLVVPGTVTDGVADVDAQVLSVAVSADGTFLFENVPSPATYQLIVSKVGFATETRDVTVGPAQNVENISIVLRKGDGTIRGRIITAGGPLGGATIEATDGVTKVSTVSLTEQDIGAFALRSLATPQTYTLTISRPGYRTETQTVSLTTAQDFTVPDILLVRSTGSIGGTVSQVGVGGIGGVEVTISAGDTTVKTFTASTGDVGSFFVDQLPIPNTYTVTFTKPGLLQQVRVQDLDPANAAEALAITVAMPRSTANVFGVVRAADNQPVAFATVTLNDGTTKRVLTSANDPLGGFSFTDVPPGAYTITASLPGTSPAVQLVNLIANDDRALDIRLGVQASATGQVLILRPSATTTNPNSAATTTIVPGGPIPTTTTAPPITGQLEPFVGATVRLFLATKFPGPPSNAVDVQTTDSSGRYTFSALEAPENYVIAVYQTALSPEPLDTKLIVTQPGTQLPVPTFEIPVSF